MTTQEKLKELESWAEDLRNGNTPTAAVFKNPEMVADKARMVVSELFHVSFEELGSRNRHERISWPRQIAMVMTRRISNCTLEEVGRIFQRDHGTVLHAERSLEKHMGSSKQVRQQITAIEQKLREIFDPSKP